MIPKRVIHLLSGGLDSVVLLYDLIDQGCDVHCVLFNYGQAHANRELSRARAILQHLNFFRGLMTPPREIGWTEVNLPAIRGSTLTDGAGSKVVPNRNAIFLSVATAIAMNAKAESITYACNKDDAADFPDCRKEFVRAMNEAAKAAATGIEICAPYIDLPKKEIVAIGRRLFAPLNDTWSCYVGGFDPCGECDACKKRAEAMA